MSRNISFSDSQEHEAQNDGDDVWKYTCPPDFMPCNYNYSVKNKKRKNTELWLIKAPAHFNHNSLADLKVSLSGLETIQPSDNSSKIYNVLASPSCPADFHLVTSVGQNQNASISASGFTGVLSINESYADCGSNQALKPVPTAAKPSIPEGLKQRFRPFGSLTAHNRIQNMTCYSSSKKEQVLEETEGQRPKKKKKKDKRSEEESFKVPYIKQEYISLGLDVPVAEEEEQVRKKKKKKKEKEKKNELEEHAILIPKEEPTNTSNDDYDSVKKAKKKRHK